MCMNITDKHEAAAAATRARAHTHLTEQLPDNFSFVFWIFDASERGQERVGCIHAPDVDAALITQAMQDLSIK